MSELWRWVRRPYRLVTLAIAIVMATVFVYNIVFSGGALDDTPQGEILAWAAGGACVLLAVGLGGMWQRVVEVGLVVSAGVLVGRMAFVAMTSGVNNPEFWFNAAWVIVTVGTYLLETLDTVKYPRPSRARSAHGQRVHQH